VSDQPEINRLDELAQFIAGKIPPLIGEAMDQINAAIDATVVSAQEDESGTKEAVLSLPIAVKWNMDTNKVEVALAVTVKHKFSGNGELPNHDQPALPGIDGDGELSPATQDAAKRFARSMRKAGVKLTVTKGRQA